MTRETAHDALVSPELALVDPLLRARAASAEEDVLPATPPRSAAWHDERVRAALRRIGACAELEAPEPPRRSWRLRFAGVAALWLEAAALAAQVSLGAS
ncbi:MAG TPA: hypothetical protein VNJ53_09815 [Gaiellaceae bacterium]|nr:hypothetical protein [Gaiellaceae bacterium]